MKQMELFAGIGGFGLAGEWAGIESVVQVEWDPFCQKVLAKNFPNAKRFGDITKFDGSPYRGAIDIISGGFPCQPYSTAGKRLGKEDDRHLWPEMLRVIRQVAPRWVVGENVRGLISWNGGMVFDEVQADLEAAGYEVQAFLLPACGVNAPHRRDRVWFIANATGIRFDWNDWERQEGQQCGERRTALNIINGNGREGLTTNGDSQRLQERVYAGFGSVPQSDEPFPWGESSRTHPADNWSEFPTQSPVCGRNDGISRELDETLNIIYYDEIGNKKRNEEVGKNRIDRIAALGNAIVPQVAYQIFKAIIEYEKTTKCTTTR